MCVWLCGMSVREEETHDVSLSGRVFNLSWLFLVSEEKGEEFVFQYLALITD